MVEIEKLGSTMAAAVTGSTSQCRLMMKPLQLRKP